MYFIYTPPCGNVINPSIVMATLFDYHSSQTETATWNVRGAWEFIQKATRQNKLKHMKTENNTGETQMWQMEMKKRGRRAGEELSLMEECLFYSDSNVVQKVCLRHGREKKKNKGGWQQRQPGVQKIDRNVGCAARERGEDAQPASGVKGVKI